MIINSDINVLGSLSDFNLIIQCLEDVKVPDTQYKTLKSLKRFKSAINSTLLKYYNPEIETLVVKFLQNEKISSDSLLVLFWNASLNNELLFYLNSKVYFPAIYSGRVTIRLEEGVSCLEELRETNETLQKWTEITIQTTASKYITLLKKFNLMEGNAEKLFTTPYLSDDLFVIFFYFILSYESNSNILKSNFLHYSFSEKDDIIKRILRKQFIHYFNIQYSGARLTVERKIPNEEIYNELKSR